MTEIVLAASLSRTHSFYNEKLFNLSESFGTLENLYTIWKSGKSHPLFSEQLRNILTIAWQPDHLHSEDELFKRYNIEVVLHNSSDYPELLRHIPDKPFQLYIRGDKSLLRSTVLVSCVGSRHISSYGEQVIPRLFEPFRATELTVVSGLALGVDAFVNKVALGCNLKTVAVLGGGLDKIEPQTNQALGELIIEKGCLVSEYPPEVRPRKHHFLERNRIIAGLSHATIIIEGSGTSGSLVTARMALQYGREVGAVPGSLFHPLSVAPHRLLRDGAWPVIDSTDIASLLNLKTHDTVSEVGMINSVHALLQKGEATFDDLTEKLKINPSELQSELTELELNDIIAQSSHGAYYLKHGR